MSAIAIKLKPAAERKVKQGHPWVFNESIVKQSRVGNVGEKVVVFDNKKNKFLAFGLYDPSSPIRVKILSRKPLTVNGDWFLEQFYEAYDKRKSLLKTNTNSYRLIYGESDGFPGLIVDVYADVIVIKLYSLIWHSWLDDIVKALIQVSKAKTAVLRLSRNVQKETDALKDGDLLHGQLENEIIEFVEHDVKFSANVIHGHKTGYFLDHRYNRNKVGAMASGKKVLDVFSYAGGFSVHALVGGAEQVTSVDISKQALEVAQFNASLNDYWGEHKIIAGDAFEVLENLQSNAQKFDVVVIDPPSFAKNKLEIPGALRSYRRLVNLGQTLVSRGGVLVMASCTARLKPEEFFKLVEDELKSDGRKFNVLEKTDHDVDHPVGFEEARYLKCGYYRIG